jgi:hypothetical protein
MQRTMADSSMLHGISFDASAASINESWHRQVVVALVGRVRRAQHLAGQLRFRTQMRTMMTILVVLALPSPKRDCMRFESPVSGTGDRSRSVGEEACAFDGALLSGVHRPMQA